MSASREGPWPVPKRKSTRFLSVPESNDLILDAEFAQRHPGQYRVSVIVFGQQDHGVFFHRRTLAFAGRWRLEPTDSGNWRRA